MEPIWTYLEQTLTLYWKVPCSSFAIAAEKVDGDELSSYGYV